MLDNSNVAPGKNKTLRCAIYTRKSHEEGLEQEFNSLDAQRESAEHYIEAQRMRGWTALPDHYDDGGFSGGNMERPGLRRLLADIDAGKIDVIVVYKVDRLSRSLLDFMKMIDLFNEKGVSFVSVTQHFSTTDPTGRMFLGILITFAQYEREVIAERIRDKVAAAKRRGKYCGGVPILGYDVDRDNKKLLVNPDEARTVQYIFRRFIQIGSAKKLGQELNERGTAPRPGPPRKARCARAPNGTPPTSTGCSTTGSISARSPTRTAATPASTKGSSTGRPGTRFRPSWRTTNRSRYPWPEPKWSPR